MQEKKKRIKFINCNSNYISLSYYRKKAVELASEYVEQRKKAFELGLYDYYTEDIANDWLREDYNDLCILQKEGRVSLVAVELYKKIEDNFAAYSIGGPKYEPIIWTLDGMEKHSFWARQRELASMLLIEL